MDDLTLDAYNQAALESYDRAAEAGPDEPDEEYAICDRHGHFYAGFAACPTCVADDWPPADEPGADWFDGYAIDPASGGYDGPTP